MSDGIPLDQQITLEELDAIDRHIGEQVVALMADPKNRADEGYQNDPNQQIEYFATLRVVLGKDRRTGEIVSNNTTLLMETGKVQFRKGLSIENGVIGGRLQAFRGFLSKVTKFAPYLEAVIGAGGSVPALLLHTAESLLQKRVKPGGLLDQLIKRKPSA